MNQQEAEAFVSAVVLLRESAHDKDASRCVSCYPSLSQGGKLVKHGTRIQWKGKLMRAAVDLWDTAENAPNRAPSLWEEILYKDGYRIIPETITVGTAFAKGEKGWWMDQLYTSTLDNNVWTPQQNPAGWEIAQ